MQVQEKNKILISQESLLFAFDCLHISLEDSPSTHSSIAIMNNITKIPSLLNNNKSTWRNIISAICNRRLWNVQVTVSVICRNDYIVRNLEQLSPLEHNGGKEAEKARYGIVLQ